MPYTPKDRRARQSTEIRDLNLEKVGDLTAIIFELQLIFIMQHELTYSNIKDSIAAANDANDEVKDRLKRYYENKCIEKNADFPQVEKILDKIDEKFDTTESTLEEATVKKENA